jgi:shikimate dehydrogenase
VAAISADPADASVRRLAVLGSPIGHSKSPALHSAAYRVLGLPWQYTAVELGHGTLQQHLSTLDDSWRGLSLTMPLKREVLPLLDEASSLVAQTGAANTVLIDDGRLIGENTDVGGILDALADHGIVALSVVHVLGSGATAASAVAAAAQLGAERVVVSSRRPEAGGDLVGLAERLGTTVELRRFGDPLGSALAGGVELLIDTLPGGVDVDDLPVVDDAAALFAVAYDPWPSARANRLHAHGGTVIDGLEMLVNQAIRQVRVFVTGDQQTPLPDEEAVARAMRSAVERS